MRAPSTAGRPRDASHSVTIGSTTQMPQVTRIAARATVCSAPWGAWVSVGNSTNMARAATSTITTATDPRALAPSGMNESRNMSSAQPDSRNSSIARSISGRPYGPASDRLGAIKTSNVRDPNATAR